MGGLSLGELDHAVVWHDVECAGYAADLPLWRRLAAQRPGPLLDLGAGTGRVALDLAGRGHEVSALDSERPLVAALAARARERGLDVAAAAADIRSFALGGQRFALAIAPMQVFQLLGGAPERAAALAAVRSHLAPAGLLAVALADPFEGVSSVDEALPPLPDVREHDGWVFQSTPTRLRSVAGATDIERVRQAVSPSGELHESLAVIRLDAVVADELERAALELGYRVLGRELVPETEAYVGSTVVMLEAT